MRAKLLAVAMALALAGCATTQPEIKVITKIQYVRDDIPSTMLTTPDRPTDLNVDDPHLTQKDVGLWIIDQATYSNTLEIMIDKIKEYQTKRNAEVDRLNKEQENK